MYIGESAVWLGWSLFYGHPAVWAGSAILCAAWPNIVRWRSGSSSNTSATTTGPIWRRCGAGYPGLRGASWPATPPSPVQTAAQPGGVPTSHSGALSCRTGEGRCDQESRRHHDHPIRAGTRPTRPGRPARRRHGDGVRVRCRRRPDQAHHAPARGGWPSGRRGDGPSALEPEAQRVGGVTARRAELAQTSLLHRCRSVLTARPPPCTTRSRRTTPPQPTTARASVPAVVRPCRAADRGRLMRSGRERVDDRRSSDPSALRRAR